MDIIFLRFIPEINSKIESYLRLVNITLGHTRKLFALIEEMSTSKEGIISAIAIFKHEDGQTPTSREGMTSILALSGTIAFFLKIGSYSPLVHFWQTPLLKEGIISTVALIPTSTYF